MKPTTEHRLLWPLQRRGNIGKSTLLAILAQYCEQRGVPWRGYDLDPEHRSFSRLFPSEVTLCPLSDEPETEVIKLARKCTDVPVTLVDPRAHISDLVLRGLEMIRFPEHFAAQRGRLVVALFPGDDLEMLTDIDGLVSRLRDKVDYLVVRNPARQPRTRMFDGSALEEELRRLDAVSLEIPPLLAIARNHLASLEVELGRGVTHVEAVADRSLPLDAMVRLVIEDWIRVVFRRLDQVASVLLPSNYARTITAVDNAAMGSAPRIVRGAKINRSNL